MSGSGQKSEKASEGERTSPSIEFLYDFVYVDHQRIRSYFAQMDPNGALTQTVEGLQDSSSGQVTNAIGPKFLNEVYTENDQSLRSLQRHFDPAWVLPITVLNRLDEAAFVHRDVTRAPLGSLVLVQGSIGVIDIRMLRELWPMIVRQMAADDQAAQPALNRKQRRGVERHKVSTADRQSDDLAAIIGKLPHALQMHFSTEREAIWSTLAPENMTITPDDFALKHGAAISGRWYLLGILDASTDEDDLNLSDHPAFYQNELAVGMMQLLIHLRAGFGRPHGAYGVTPLMIFRAVRPATT